MNVGALLRRVARSVLLVAAVASLTFVLNGVLPSDPARLVAGPQARPAEVARIRTSLGLDRPLWVRYGLFVRRLVHLQFSPPSTPSPSATEDPAGASVATDLHENCAQLGVLHIDLGRSYQQRRPVVEAIGERLPRTLALAAAAVFLQGTLGLLLAIAAVRKLGGWQDRAAIRGSILGGSLPTFVLGTSLQFVFAQLLGWLPMDGFGKTLSEHAVGLILPATTLGLAGAASYARLMRDELARELARDHVRTALAKGAGPWRRLFVHAVRNALPTMVTLLALDFGQLAGGAVVTETLFRWPGLGNLGGRALLDRDGPMLVGVVLVTAVGVIAANGLADALQALLDPRTRREV